MNCCINSTLVQDKPKARPKFTKLGGRKEQTREYVWWKDTSAA